MKRRLGRIIEFALIAGFLTLELVIGRLPDTPQWYATPLYYGLVFGALLIGFWFLWVWADTGEKTEIDELEEAMEQHFGNLSKDSKRIVNELKKIRRSINAKDK